MSDGIGIGDGAGGRRPRLSVTPGVSALNSPGKVIDLIWSRTNKGFQPSQISGEHRRGKVYEKSQLAAQSHLSLGRIGSGLKNMIYRRAVRKMLRERSTRVAGNKPNERCQLIYPVLAVSLELFNNPERHAI